MTRVLPTWTPIPQGGDSAANAEYFALCLDGVVQNMLSFDLVISLPHFLHPHLSLI